MIEIRQVPFGSDDHARLVQLRREVLRWPLGLEYTPEQLASEADQVHLGAFDGDRAVGCLLLAFAEPGVAQMRQVAVAPDLHRTGVGRRLVKASESMAGAMGARRIMLHARQTAVAFYLALGYEIVGEPFVEVGLPHRPMERNLTATSEPSAPPRQ